MDGLPEARTFAGRVYCHAPADRPFRLEALARPADEADRWSVAGTVTAYLGSSPTVAAAEWARHAGPADDRSIVALELRPIHVADQRRVAGASSAADSAADPCVVLDRAAARDLAAATRQAGVAGMLVPSIAFLDRPEEAFNIVLFCDLIPGGIRAILREERAVGRIRLDTPG